MDYQQTLNYLFEQLPMYQRVGNAAYKTDLKNTIELCSLLGNPEKEFKSIHIAGTNGKGSTSHMIASIFQEAGYKVGLYTSPHLKDFRERVKINGLMISESEVIRFVSQYKDQFEQINLSFFEWTVGLAFNYFSENKVDIAIVETGLGGRLDSTNVIVPKLSIITNIGLDHTQFLGNTLGLIAGEKAGIIKKNVPVVIGETQESIKEIFIDKANSLDSTICFADSIKGKIYESDLKGIYQKQNIKTVLSSIHQLNKDGWDISEENIEVGLSNVIKNTGLYGRWQILSNNPLTICDTGHNEAGISCIVEQLKTIKYNRLRIVFGAVNDKSIGTILNLLPKEAQYYFCQASIPRALNADELLFEASKYDLIGETYKSVQNALKAAKNDANKDDLIFVGGSTFVVAEVV